MYRFHRLPLLGVALFISHAALAAAPLQSLYASTRVTQITSGQKVVHKAETWIKNGKMRTKMGNDILIRDGKNQMSFNVKDPQKRVVIVPLPKQEQAKSTPELLQKMFMPPTLNKLQRKKVGTAKVLGHPTTIYQITMPGSNGTMKMWMAHALGGSLPLRAEAKSPGGTWINETVVLKINHPIPDTFFAAPAGFKKMSIPSTPPLPPGAKPKAKP